VKQVEETTRRTHCFAVKLSDLSRGQIHKSVGQNNSPHVLKLHIANTFSETQ